MADIMRVEILPDGTIKTTTDPISGANHQTAENFLKTVTTLTGGDVTRQKRGNTHHHHHGHTHTHDHADHNHSH